MEKKNHPAADLEMELDAMELDDVGKRLCGIGSFRPKRLQILATMSAFVGVFSTINIFKQTLVSFLGSQVPSVEKQFGLTSYHMGILMSLNDIGFLATCLFATMLAPYVHIPVAFFATFMIYGLSGIMAAIPHFINQAYGNMPGLSTDANSTTRFTQSKQIQMCVLGINDYEIENSTMSFMEICAAGKGGLDEDAVVPWIRTVFLVMFGSAMVIQGVAKSVRGPLLTVYIDDGGDRKKTGFYMGTYFITVKIVYLSFSVAEKFGYHYL